MDSYATSGSPFSTYRCNISKVFIFTILIFSIGKQSRFKLKRKMMKQITEKYTKLLN
eukprot:TRINITY_DN7406_c0_g1_i1.p1 TRINITY_DN7406_c0_g1~~TRINITY_DN7406_c0_g1_i1.p1  ORF type:complete len:57 (-),score=8.29 TRINITY_DN7406_c0_g1_i1:103-273(-)